MSRTLLIKSRDRRLGNRTEWDVMLDGRIIPEICWDEMLGAVARVLFCGATFDFGKPTCPIDYHNWIEVAEVEPGYWTISQGGEFIDHLTSDEALGFVAAYTLDGRQLFSGMKSYEQHARCRYRGLNRPISGLLALSK